MDYDLTSFFLILLGNVSFKVLRGMERAVDRRQQKIAAEVRSQRGHGII